MCKRIIGIIPARYASTRFPGKPLVDIAGKSMIQRVYEQSSKANQLDKVIVATDDDRIYNEIVKFGGHVIMTSSDHQNGTERCHEVVKSVDEVYDYAINIQGDEPFIQPEMIDALADILDGQTELGTLVKKVTDPTSLTNPNTMKVVINHADEALYFSRNCIPYVRGHDPKEWLNFHDFYKHIGIYAYRIDILKRIALLKTGKLEKAESLEQLRWLEKGFKIKIAKTKHESQGIDTPEDLLRLENLLKSEK